MSEQRTQDTAVEPQVEPASDAQPTEEVGEKQSPPTTAELAAMADGLRAQVRAHLTGLGR